MAYYTHEYSNFPFEIMALHNFKDVDDSVANEINQIKTLQSQGKYDKVNEIVRQNRERLKKYCHGADFINEIDESTRNVQIFAISKKQSIYYLEDEPEWATTSDVWIGCKEDILT